MVNSIMVDLRKLTTFNNNFLPNGFGLDILYSSWTNIFSTLDFLAVLRKIDPVKMLTWDAGRGVLKVKYKCKV